MHLWRTLRHIAAAWRATETSTLKHRVEQHTHQQSGIGSAVDPIMIGSALGDDV
jgi:hypothetical protein